MKENEFTKPNWGGKALQAEETVWVEAQKCEAACCIQGNYSWFGRTKAWSAWELEWMSSDVARRVSKDQMREVLLVKEFTLKVTGNLWKA